MTAPRQSIPLRAILVGIGTGALLWAGVIGLQFARAVRPAADNLQGLTSDLLADHDSMTKALARLRAVRREVVALSQLDDLSARVRHRDSISADVRAQLDRGAAMRASVERSDIPLEMRLLLAEAIEVQAGVAVDLLEAIRADAAGDVALTLESLRRSGVRADSAAALLFGAERVALVELLAAQERLAAQVGRLNRAAVATAGVGLVLILLTFWLVRTRFYRPVQEMERAVRSISEGDLTTEIPVEHADELGTLASHFNAMTAVLRDREAEELRRRDNLTERFGRILDESSNEICVFDSTTLRLLQANRGARHGLGYGAKPMPDVTLSDLLAGMAPERFEMLIGGLRRGKPPRLLLTTWLRRHDGSLRPTELTIQHASDGESGVFITVAEDAGVRQRVRALDDRLREFALRYQDVLVSGDLEAALKPLSRMGAEALETARCGIWRHGNDEVSPIVVFDAAKTEFVTAAPLTVDGPSDDSGVLRLTLTSGARTLGYLLLESTNPGRIWTAEERTFAGAVAGLAVRAFEANERRTLEQALERAQRMDSIGQLAGGVAHDFNNILTAILGNLESCREDLEPDHPLQESLQEAQHAAHRAADLTRQLLTFARRQVVEISAMDPAAAARDAEAMLRRLVGAGKRLTVEVAPDVGHVRLGSGQMEQLLMNLVVNARDASAEGGEVRVELREVTLSAAAAAEHPGLAEGRYVEIAVSDAGVGMDARTLERVFEPFFTTKRLGEGTGLGLAVCYGIVRNAGGVIAVQSEVGRGTTFRILLPSASRRSSPSLGVTVGAPTSSQPFILLAEDELAIRALLTRMLTTRGYQVVAAEDGEDALQKLAGETRAPDLLISDIVMPRRGGVELARELRRRYPQLPVLFISGYTAMAAVQDGELEDAMFLSKPFNTDDMLRRVRTLLDTPATESATPR